MRPATVSIPRATAIDLPALHALLQLYYSEGDPHHTEDEQPLRATPQPIPLRFLLSRVLSDTHHRTKHRDNCYR